MAHPLRVSPLSRILLVLTLAVPSMLAASAQAQEAPAQWQLLSGPGGRLTHLVASPEGRDFYAVSVAGVHRQADQTQWRDSGPLMWSDALYRSSDAGATWQAATNDLPPGEITALYADHLGHLWTAIRSRAALPEVHSKLWRSDDGGATWRESPLGSNAFIIRTITQDSNRQILLGADGPNGIGSAVLLRSEDDGTSWSSQPLSIQNGESGVRLERLIAHPSRANTLFAVAAAGELLRSDDGGASWQLAAGALSNGLGSAQLAFLPDQPDTAILVQSQLSAVSIRRSTDGGATWSDVRATGLPTNSLDLHSMTALPRSVLLLNTGVGTYRSADAGRRWQPLEGALSSGFVRAWAAQGRSEQGMLAATDYGLFVSSDAGAVWRSYGTGLPNNSGIASLLTHRDRPQMIAASLHALGDADPPEFLLSRDGGRAWSPVDGGGIWGEATAWAVDPTNPDVFYTAGKNYVASSKDGGFSWQVQRVSNASPSTIAVSRSDSSRVYVDGVPGVHSPNGGQTWNELSVQPQDGVKATVGLAIDPANALHLWGGGPDGVRESRDGGNSWQRWGLDGRAVRWLTVSGDETNQADVTVYAGLRDGGMMRRHSSNDEWQPADRGLPSSSLITSFAVDPRAPGLLWAARDGGGIYRSTNGGDSWSNVGVGVGENVGLSLAVNYQAPGSVFFGTAIAGLWVLGSDHPTPRATETPAGSATNVPADATGRTGVDARIEVLWPHEFAPIDQARQANVGIRLFVPRSLEPPACGWQPKVQLWRAVDNEPAEPVDTADQRSVDGQPFPYWEANDVDVSPARDSTQKLFFLVEVDSIDTASSVWAHASDARTYFPEQLVPSGIATGAVDAVDARIQIVWPHDETGAEKGVDEANLANVVVSLFKHGTRLSVSPEWRGEVVLFGAWNSEVARAFASEATVGRRQAGVISYPVWEFNDVPVSRAKDTANKLYLWAVARGVKSHPTIWAHGSDARTYFPEQDEPVQGCQP